MVNYTPETQRKIQLYLAADYLFESGNSHPQVVGILQNYEIDTELLVVIADQAQKSLWQKIYNECQRMTAEGKNFEQIIEAGKLLLDDTEIVDFICRSWYNVTVSYATHEIESRSNIAEGTQGILVSIIGSFFVYIYNASLFQKIIWPTALLVSAIVWVYGIHQKKLAKKLKQILSEDYSKFEKLV